MLYSDELNKYTGELNGPINKCIQEIEKYFDIEGLPIYQYGDYSIAIPINLTVSIPPMGTVGGIDIRKIEPILIRLSLGYYPHIIPFVMSDRKDFPKDKLSHLYADRDNKPARLCLVRNNPNEWFSNKRIKDFLHVVEEWFFKAGADLLNEDGNEFDPIRLENYYGDHIYTYEIMHDIVSTNNRFIPELPFAILFGTVRNDDAKSDLTCAYKSFNSIPLIQASSLTSALSKVENEIDTNTIPEKPIFSILVWPANLNIESEYFTSLPETYLELKKIFRDRNIDMDSILSIYSNTGFHKVNGIIVTLAIKRPKKLIGYNFDIEFINFRISGKEYKDGKMPDNASVVSLRHIEPFTCSLAELVSGQKRNKKILYAGAGSLGSKMIMHEVRSGNKNISVVDDDTFLQHNLVRHTLYNSNIGKNKAAAIIEEAESFFRFDHHVELKSFDRKVSFLTEDELKPYEWIVDTTASFGVQNWLCENKTQQNTNVCRCELANEGKLGLLYIEGSLRNPRIDDMINLLYYEAISNKAIEEWRINDSAKEPINLSIGLGCSSSTTVMSDDSISLHSASFSQVLYNEYDRKNIEGNGLIFINKLNSVGLLSISSENILVKPFLILSCLNNSGWEVRVKNGVDEKIFSLVKMAGVNETGGVLIGIANYKTKTIHVLDIIKATVDSKGTPGRFKRGIKNLPEQIDEIKEKTGNMIGYIGEWHSHPMGLEQLSNIDIANIALLQKENHKVPIPTCAVIISNGKILPFVFD